MTPSPADGSSFRFFSLTAFAFFFPPLPHFYLIAQSLQVSAGEVRTLPTLSCVIQAANLVQDSPPIYYACAVAYSFSSAYVGRPCRPRSEREH